MNATNDVSTKRASSNLANATSTNAKRQNGATPDLKKKLKLPMKESQRAVAASQ